MTFTIVRTHTEAAYLVEGACAMPVVGVLVLEQGSDAELGVVVQDGRLQGRGLFSQSVHQLSTQRTPETQTHGTNFASYGRTSSE